MKKFFCGLAALACLSFAAAAAVLPAEKLLPDDTLVLFSIPDFTRALAIYSNAPQAQFWNDPAMRPFKDKFMNKLSSQFIAPLEHDLGIKFDDYTSLPQGQLTVALIPDGAPSADKEPPAPAVILLLDTKGKSAQLKSNLADLKKKWLDAGKTVKTEKIRDLDFSAITLSTNDLPKSLQKLANNQDTAADTTADAGAKKDTKQMLYLGQAESLFIMGTSPKVIEKVLAAMAGGSVKILGDVPAFSANYNGMFRDSPVYSWVNARAFLDMAKRAAGTVAGSDVDKYFSAIGLNGLKSLAFSYTYSDDGVQFNFLVGVPESSRTGIFKILAGEPKDVNPPPFVPADVAKFSRWRIDGQKTWAGLRQILGDISPQYLGSVDFVLSSVEESVKQKNPDFDIKKNLFGNLGDDLVTYQKNPKVDSLQDLNSAPTLYLLASPNPEQLANALKSMLVLTGPAATPTERDFRGRKIYSIPLPGAPPAGDDSKSAPSSLSYAFSGGYVAMSTDSSILEEYLRSSESQGKSLRETPGLAAAIQKVAGSGTSLFGYSNETETMRALFNILKKDPSLAGFLGTLEPVASAMGMDDLSPKDWVDVSLLPSFDRISKYFYFGVYAAGASPDGLYLKAFAPVPPQLKK
jgi:hypothetical protein